MRRYSAVFTAVHNLALWTALPRCDVLCDSYEFLGSEVILENRKGPAAGFGVQPASAEVINFDIARKLLLRHVHRLTPAR